jgi:hypothetical protein
MGLVEPCGKQKRKLDDISTENDTTTSCTGLKSKIQKLDGNKTKTAHSSNFLGTLPKSVEGNQGEASSSLAFLNDKNQVKSSIFDSLNSTVDKNETNSSSLKVSTLSSAILGKDASSSSKTETSLKTKKYKIVQVSCLLFSFKAI